jgi:DNA-binding transcriptional ArsR family regulator
MPVKPIEEEVGITIRSAPHDTNSTGNRYPLEVRKAVVRAILQGRKEGMLDVEAVILFLGVTRGTAYQHLAALKRMGLLPKRPLGLRGGETSKRTIRIPDTVWSDAGEVARRNGTTLSAMVNEYLKSILPNSQERRMWEGVTLERTGPCPTGHANRKYVVGVEICTDCFTRMKG